jgi:ABC-type uncharacterized transport system permease subunit
MDKLTVLCFAGTYALALLAEIARFAARLREAAGRVAPAALAALGWAVHTAYLGNLAAQRRAVPVTTAFESLLVLGWVLAAIALYLMARGGRANAAGPIVLGLTLADLTVAALWAPRGGSWEGLGGWMRFWGAVHGIFLLLGAVCTCLAFVFGLTYLAQARRLKLKRPAGRGVALPSLEQSERWNRSAITLAFPLLTAGLLIGLGLTIAAHRAGGVGLAWTDPKVLSMVAVWFVFAALLHARFRSEWRGRRVMVLTVVAFAFLAFAMVGVGLVLPTAHGGVGRAASGGSR